jgi:outer membrane protein assembly factor BamB
MNRPSLRLPLLALLACLGGSSLLARPAAAAESEGWPQWGGPGRDFHAPAEPLAVEWPEEGPKRLWSRELGGGYSAIIAVGDRLYTLTREGKDENVVAFRAADGTELWRHHYPAEPLDGMRLGYGEGPHSTPLWVDGRLFAVGVTGHLSALDAATGELLWQRFLWPPEGEPAIRRGYASSPIAHGDKVIVQGGGEDSALALRQSDGHVVWRATGFRTSPSSPILIEVAGIEQLIIFAADEVVSLAPETGEILWRRGHPANAVYNITSPLWYPEERLLFLTSAYGGGTRVLRLGVAEGEPTVEELWHHDRFRVHFSNAVRVEGYVYASNGSHSGAFLTAIDLHTGETAWRTREIRRGNLVAAGDKLLVLDEEGRLFLINATPDHLGIYARARLVEAQTWTVPTLVGRRLYLRTEKRLMAFELPAP